MVRDPLSDDDPGLTTVLSALHDEDCRTIVDALDEPRTAQELDEEHDIPRSTLYRKLDQLVEATLVFEGTEIREDGSHAGLFQVDFDSVLIIRESDRKLYVEIERPARRADDRLAELWSEVRREI